MPQLNAQQFGPPIPDPGRGQLGPVGPPPKAAPSQGGRGLPGLPKLGGAAEELPEAAALA